MSIHDDLPLLAAAWGVPAERVVMRLRDRKVMVLNGAGGILAEMDADEARLQADAERERRHRPEPASPFTDEHLQLIAEIDRRAGMLPR